MKVTIRDIARKLNLNPSSVSYALSGKGSIKPETRELVKRTAEEMGYIPNSFAKKVSTGKSNLAGIVMPNILFGLGEFVQHTSHLLLDAGLDTNISVTEFSDQREQAAVRYLLESCTAGFIIRSNQEDWSRTPAKHPLRIVAEHRIPVVSFGYSVEGSPFSCVNIDMYQNGRVLGQHLYKKGCRKVAMMVPHPPPFFRNVHSFLDGVTEVTKGALQVTPVWLDGAAESPGRSGSNPQYSVQLNEFLSGEGLSGGARMMRQLIESNALPDAVVCLSENIVMGAWHEAVKHGVDIPGDMRLACAERSMLLSHLPISVTSASVPMEQAAKASVSMLLDAMKHPGKATELKLAPELQIGETT